MTRLRSFRVLLPICALTVSWTLLAQGPAGNQPQAPATYSQDSLIQSLKWRNIGNANLIGRISAIDALENDFAHVVVGSAAGGVFKSTNAGVTWTPIFDTYGAASIGDVAIFQKDPNIIWVGTGEECGRNSAAWGDGIYKSTDGGKTFTHMGLKDTYTIGSVVVHPTDPNIVYVAAAGNIWGKIGDRGFFKTVDGGKTWTKLTSNLPNDGLLGTQADRVEPGQRRRQRRHLQDHRRRQDLQEADEGTADGEDRQDRPRHRARQPEGRDGARRGGVSARPEQPGVPRHVEDRRGDLPLRGRRRDVDVHEPLQPAAVLLQPRRDQPVQRQGDVSLQHLLRPLERRRQDARGDRTRRRWRRGRIRRQPAVDGACRQRHALLARDLARPAQQEALLDRQRRRHRADA
jgi:hypothetical protein